MRRALYNHGDRLPHVQMCDHCHEHAHSEHVVHHHARFCALFTDMEFLLAIIKFLRSARSRHRRTVEVPHRGDRNCIAYRQGTCFACAMHQEGQSRPACRRNTSSHQSLKTTLPAAGQPSYALSRFRRLSVISLPRRSCPQTRTSQSQTTSSLSAIARHAPPPSSPPAFPHPHAFAAQWACASLSLRASVSVASALQQVYTFSDEGIIHSLESLERGDARTGLTALQGTTSAWRAASCPSAAVWLVRVSFSALRRRTCAS